MTNYFEYRLIDKNKVTYHNGWVKDIEKDILISRRQRS